MVTTIEQKERETPRRKKTSLTWKYNFTITAVKNLKCDYRKN